MHFLGGINIAIAFCAFLLNSSLLLLLVVHRLRFSLQPSMDFLKNMLFCHLLSSTYSIYFECERIETYHMKHHISLYIYVLFVALSISAICAINIDRFIFIRFPLKYSVIVSKRRARIVIAINYTIPGTCFVVAVILVNFSSDQLSAFVSVSFIVLAVTGILVVIVVTFYVFLTVRRHRLFYGNSVMKGSTSISRGSMSKRSVKSQEEKKPAITGAFQLMARDYFGFDNVPVASFSKEENKVYFTKFFDVKTCLRDKQKKYKSANNNSNGSDSRSFSAVGLLSRDLIEGGDNFLFNTHMSMRGNRPITYIALVLSSSFIICGIPNVIRAAFATLNKHSSIYLPLIGNLFMNINMLLDPIVILMKNLKIRRELKKFLCRR